MKLLQDKIKSFYMTEGADRNAFNKLDKTEYSSVALQYGLSEYAGVASLVGTLFKGKKAIDNEELGKISVIDTAYFQDIDKASGDITKTKHHKDMMSLLNYALSANAHSTSASGTGSRLFDSMANSVLLCAKQFEVNAPKFKAQIAKERTTANSRQLTAAFFKLSVYLLQTTADILYSNSLKAEFDYNVKPIAAKNVFFSYDSGVVDEAVVYIQYLENAMRNGKLFSALNGPLHETLEQGLTSLTMIQEGALQENILDTIFGLVSHFKILDAIVLFPIYLTRLLAYYVMYTVATVKSINLGIDESIALQRSKTLTQDQYNAYRTAAAPREIALQQNLAKADVTIDMNAEDDKKLLAQGASSVLI